MLYFSYIVSIGVVGMEDIKNLENQKPKRKNKFKIFTFFSGLLTLVLSVCVFFFTFYILFTLYPQWINEDAATVIVGIFLLPALICLVGVCCIAGVLYMVLGILSIVASFKEDKSFLNWKGLVITVIVFEFLIATITLIMSMMDLGEGSMAIFLSIAAVVLFSAILKIIELVMLKKRMKKSKNEVVVKDMENTSVQPKSETSSNINFDVLKSNNNESSKIEDIQDKK